MKTIRLHGWLGQQFGKSFELDVQTPAEAIRAICTQMPSLRKALAEDVNGFKCFLAKSNIGQESLIHPFSHLEIFHIVPSVTGSAEEGKSGGEQILIGIVLLVAAYFTAGSSTFLVAAAGEGMFTLGTAMVIGGISTLLFAPPSVKSSERPENKPNYAFNGSVNTIQQGGCVPVLYGELITGSQVVSAGLYTEDIRV